MWQYGSSLNTATFRPRTTSAIAARSSSVATPPVGLCGEFRKIAFGAGSSARNCLMSIDVWPELVLLAQRRQNGSRLPALDVRQERREVRAEHERAVARIQKCLTEELLENLRARPGDDVLRAGGNPELLAHELRGRPRETRAGPATGSSATGCRWMACSPAAFAERRALERAVADLQLDDVLALGLEGLGDGQDRESRLDVQILRKLAECDRHRQNPFADE